MLLTVVIPVYNEASTIDQIVAAVQAVDVEKEIVLVDDCSTDGSLARLEAIAAAADNVRLLKHEKNSGKGAALRTGFAAARGDLVIVQDADLEYDPQEYPRLMQPILENKADVVYGSRFAGGESHAVIRFRHYLGNKVLTYLSNLFTNLFLTDMETCYKLFRREIIQGIEIEENRFGFEPEVTAKLAKQGHRIWEISISYHGRSFAEGKKIGWKDGVRAIWCIVKYNLRGTPPPPRRRDPAPAPQSN
ncbi:MAG: glycosyltransferase family 2 protein [Phycisphaerales bacterium]|nr:glycosyltransferase family 2 protein [Phycisphaerae bacterium]NNF41791.1 glycosyltransferase family 2 protein [Phycisphaerales bacterium]NNM24858.1 glycosyltransferase family 2 protein [Phycisphaerales bacterium]